jgi:Alw26I/Eco31I/Esp3I family type II restriction m6 adenine DNA methyltransferase
MLHLKTALASSARDDIEDRLTGRFYTPLSIADRLVEFSSQLGCPESVCDPFCGDGRLVKSWLRHQARHGTLKRLNKISLWDVDAAAVKQAVDAVKSEIVHLKLQDVVIEGLTGDTFPRIRSGLFELVITNPPWEQLKPDSRDRIGNGAQYKSEIQDYATKLAKLFPGAATSSRRSIGGYTINLARAGALAAAELTAFGGLLLIVLPSTIFGDQVSSEFRRTFFSSLAVDQIDFYPAEAKYFAGVDQSFITIAGRRGIPSSEFNIRRFQTDRTVADIRKYSSSNWEEPLPLAVGQAEHDIIQRIRKSFPPAHWLESDLRFGLQFGRELDETRIAEAFTRSDLGIPFVKGRNIGRFSSSLSDLPRIDTTLRKIPVSTLQERIAWRDVSRPSQKRRMHACIIPAGVVTGNSIGIARFNSPVDGLLKTLLSVLNSIVFEIQIRGRLATNHVSQGVIRQSSIPYEIFESIATREKVISILQHAQTFEDFCVLEVFLAKKYGLTRDEFSNVLKAFKGLSEDEVEMLLDKDIWS